MSKAADRSSRMRTDEDLVSAFAIRRASVTESNAGAYNVGGRRDASARKIKKCSNYFKSRHLAFMNNPVSTTWRRHVVRKSAVLNSSTLLVIYW